ncbi:hypothetical protein H1W37_06300 [Stappia taiwanensis]|uniref:Uncharacterized protein n=1 Tax=Stappia taiwanensis TaxID=992267 RepID=A0A838XMA4_9HYPH|nr:hypothetical protein [Stappia taiwanensis]MBA4611252.1 hypothetical protein [Stappia taiwanensis]GGE87112.1 hypothetical protein GCM10007285_13450 [Stappia taiwanensis]
MTRTRDNVVPHAKVRSLRDAIRKVKFSEVERTDVVVELQESERARLEMLADELQDVFKEVPEDDDQFSFQIVPGNLPRLWIDITSHVTMGRDKRVYRFVKDTRLGRTVILETPELDDMADCITEYIAERVLERERAVEGDWLSKRLREPARNEPAVNTNVSTTPPVPNVHGLWGPFAAFAIGLMVGVIGLIGFAWFANPIN